MNEYKSSSTSVGRYEGRFLSVRLQKERDLWHPYVDIG